MKLLFAGGGTAGHINPALAIAQYVRDKMPDADILFVGNRGGMESTLVPKAGFKFAEIDVRGFRRSLSPANIKHNIGAVWRMFSSSTESAKIIAEFAPDIAVGTGGYVSGPVLRKAAKMGCPIIIHEQNAFPGVTTKMLSKSAARVMLAMPEAKRHLDEKCKIEVCGNPLRSQILSADKAISRGELGLCDEPLILSFGGSLGAGKINSAMAELLAWSSKNTPCRHIHGTGRAGYADFLKKLELAGLNLGLTPRISVRDYIDDMPRCLAAADLVIARSGAITLSEIGALGKASILIPSPNVAENHQYHNAMTLVKKDAAVLIEDKDLTGDKLIETVKDLISNKSKLEIMGENAKKDAVLDSCERIFSAILEAVKTP